MKRPPKSHPDSRPPGALLEAAAVPGLAALRDQVRALRRAARPTTPIDALQELVSKRLLALEITLLDHITEVDIATVCACAILNSEHRSQRVGGVRVDHADPKIHVRSDVGRFTSLLTVLISEFSTELSGITGRNGLELCTAPAQGSVSVSLRSEDSCAHQRVLKRVPPQSLGRFDLKIVSSGFELRG
ncbi:MAG: hypothetical protein AAF658_03410 [Myxococcota bacterium]